MQEKAGSELLLHRPPPAPPLHTHTGPHTYLAEDFLRIRLQLSAQLHAGQVSLQKQVGLDVRVIELRVIQLVGDLLSQLEGKEKQLVMNTWPCPKTALGPKGPPAPRSQPFKTETCG